MFNRKDSHMAPLKWQIWRKNVFLLWIFIFKKILMSIFVRVVWRFFWNWSLKSPQTYTTFNVDRSWTVTNFHRPKFTNFNWEVIISKSSWCHRSRFHTNLSDFIRFYRKKVGLFKCVFRWKQIFSATYFMIFCS